MTTEQQPLTPAELDEIEARANAVVLTYDETNGRLGAIFALRIDMPRLIAEVRRLWAEREIAKGMVFGGDDD